MEILSVIFLIVSLISLLVQGLSLWRLLSQQAVMSTVGRKAAKGLKRTSMSRVVAAMAYVIAAIYSLVGPELTALLSLITFSAVQVMWQANAIADVRLRRRLSNPAHVGRHRRATSHDSS